MKQICCVCGNTDFGETDTSRPFSCPVPGCGWKQDPEKPAWIVLRSPEDLAVPAESLAWLMEQREGVPDD